MAITGIKSIHYRVADEAQLSRSREFFTQFGLAPRGHDAAGAAFGLPDGGSVQIRLPQRTGFSTDISTETIWGVDTPDALASLLDAVSAVTEPQQDERGDWHFTTPDGLPLGLGLFNRGAVLARPDPLNAPGHIQRLNQWRKWRMRATPRTINHVVYGVDDYPASWAFFRHRLGFRLSDHSRGLGVFLRADGAPEHHNLFLANCHYHRPSAPSFQHACFGVEDLDELMIGANHMNRLGHVSKLGVGRHRIASALFWYVDCPAGGEAEYGADTDYLDDGWVPREWDPKFGYIAWCANLPPFMQEEAAPDMRLLASEDDVRIPDLSAYRRPRAPK
jgi:catechol 2,3-dioxygenase-like lactoylglutathione lyase family enzyme